MLNLERRTKILALIEEQGKVSVNELSRRFNTSEVTIRSDLKDLQLRGLVQRAHGGAIKVDTVNIDQSLQVKGELHADEKRRIGAAAAALVQDGESIILDSGTTTLQIARQLRTKKGLKVITNGLNIATELAGSSDIQVIMLGGIVRPTSGSVVGQFAQEMLEQLFADKLFLAVDAVDLEFGLSTPNLEESEVNQTMVRIARERILVADSSKFGKRSLSRIVSLFDLDRIITDSSLPESTHKDLRSRGLDLTLV